jgi:hypothetical protein
MLAKSPPTRAARWITWLGLYFSNIARVSLSLLCTSLSVNRYLDFAYGTVSITGTGVGTTKNMNAMPQWDHFHAETNATQGLWYINRCKIDPIFDPWNYITGTGNMQYKTAKNTGIMIKLNKFYTVQFTLHVPGKCNVKDTSTIHEWKYELNAGTSVVEPDPRYDASLPPGFGIRKSERHRYTGTYFSYPLFI